MGTSDRMGPRIRVAALVTMLAGALEEEETRHLTSARFKADLRGLRARVELELDGFSERPGLHLAEEPDDQ